MFLSNLSVSLGTLLNKFERMMLLIKDKLGTNSSQAYVFQEGYAQAIGVSLHSIGPSLSFKKAVSQPLAFRYGY